MGDRSCLVGNFWSDSDRGSSSITICSQTDRQPFSNDLWPGKPPTSQKEKSGLPNCSPQIDIRWPHALSSARQPCSWSRFKLRKLIVHCIATLVSKPQQGKKRRAKEAMATINTKGSIGQTKYIQCLGTKIMCLLRYTSHRGNVEHNISLYVTLNCTTMQASVARRAPNARLWGQIYNVHDCHQMHPSPAFSTLLLRGEGLLYAVPDRAYLQCLIMHLINIVQIFHQALTSPT
jgi:hypothetical protein